MFSLARCCCIYNCDRYSGGISLVCYVPYYHLDSGARYYDGMVPLWMAALVMLGITVVMVTRR
nr:hypothetical protein [uncultured Blautia sp.]